MPPAALLQLLCRGLGLHLFVCGVFPETKPALDSWWLHSPKAALQGRWWRWRLPRGPEVRPVCTQTQWKAFGHSGAALQVVEIELTYGVGPDIRA